MFLYFILKNYNLSCKLVFLIKFKKNILSGRMIENVLKIDNDVISSYHIYASCFPPFCGASSAK